MRLRLAIIATLLAAACSGGSTTNNLTFPTPGPTPTPQPPTFAGTWDDFKLGYSNGSFNDLGPLVVDSAGRFGVDGVAQTGTLVVTGVLSSSGVITAQLTGQTAAGVLLTPCQITASCNTLFFCSAVYPAGTFATANTPCNSGVVLQQFTMDRP